MFESASPATASSHADAHRLDAWMTAHVEGYAGGGLSLEPFAGGQSNPTFRVRTDAREYVLRRKPSGVLLPSAHAMIVRSAPAIPSTDV